MSLALAATQLAAAFAVLQEEASRLTTPASAIPTTAWGMVAASSGVTQGVLVLLAVLSLVSWAIMVHKWRELAEVRRSGDAFVNEFEHASNLATVTALVSRVDASPYTRVFTRATQFLDDTRPALSATPDRAARLSGSQVEALRLVLDSQTNVERDRLARYTPWLATIGSVSPLIGLLGTVLGVIEAFIGIATQGSGNIGAVAPGVAEALIATAAALAVAIPAVFGYNLFASALNRLDSALEGFGSEVIALMVREGRI